MKSKKYFNIIKWTTAKPRVNYVYKKTHSSSLSLFRLDAVNEKQVRVQFFVLFEEWKYRMTKNSVEFCLMPPWMSVCNLLANKKNYNIYFLMGSPFFRFIGIPQCQLIFLVSNHILILTDNAAPYNIVCG